MAGNGLSSKLIEDFMEEKRSGVVNSARRLYLFQRPLDVFKSLNSRHEAERISGTTGEDPSIESILPRISENFQIVSNIGVIVVDETVCRDTTLTGFKKLSTGLVYEHAGPDMRSSREAAGVQINEEVVKSFTALEFVGNTNMTNIQLDTVLQDLLRINRDINAPLYHTLYWNCHDIAVRFALLAMTGNDDVVQTLARQFENAKLNARYQQEFATHFGLPWVRGLINNAGDGALLSGATLGSIGGISPGALGFLATPSVMLGIMENRISRDLPTAFHVYDQTSGIKERSTLVANH